MRIIFFLALLLSPLVLSAQAHWFAPKGARWVYQNEGADKNVKTIRLERITDTIIDAKTMATLRLQHLDADSEIVFTDNYFLKIDKAPNQILLYDSFPGYGWYPLHVIADGYMPSGWSQFVHLINAFDPLKPAENQYSIIADTTTTLTVNGKELRVIHIR